MHPPAFAASAFKVKSVGPLSTLREPLVDDLPNDVENPRHQPKRESTSRCLVHTPRKQEILLRASGTTNNPWTLCGPPGQHIRNGVRTLGKRKRISPSADLDGEARSFPFTAGIEEILTAQWAIHERLKEAGTICPFVFHRNGERIRYFRAAWANACKDAGCPGALVHDMRRSAVRTFERAGVPRSVAMSIVGHKTESIYRRYAIVDEAMQREAAARLDAWVGASAPSMGTVAAFDKGKRLNRRTGS